MNSPASEPEFYSAIARVAVAQICRSVGYNAAHNSAIETLADIAGRYLRATANSAAACANSCGRTQCNLPDIVFALEDLGSVRGFSGAHKSHCLMSSSVLKEIMGFVRRNAEIPFAQQTPGKLRPELKRYRNDMGLRHVPKWLPEMPAIVEIGKGMEKERTGEEKFGEVYDWEERGERKGGNGNGKGKGFDLPEKRGKVRFKMGMERGALGVGIGNRGLGNGMKMGNNGVFCRGGNGKRILCQSWSDGDGNEE